jgi:hypothetical protein
MAASAGSLVDYAVAPTAPDLRGCTLQYTASVDLYDEICEAFEIIRLKDLHLEIKEHSIPPEMSARCVVMGCSSCRIFSIFIREQQR